MENTTTQEKESKLQKFKKYFTLFEIIWFVSLTVATIVVAIIFPEEAANGVSGTIITILYMIDVVLAIFCELLTSKQSKWSLMLYNVVELFEIIIMIILRARFASLAVSIFFWVPLHTVSFFYWGKHPDKQKTELTQVRSLKWWQSIIMVAVGAVWTLGIGYLMAAFGPETDFYSSETIVKVIAYLDACCSACSIANGILLLFRYKENWLVWYMYVIIETVINILSGQWVLLILKIGYFTNTTYGYLKWTKYIKDKDAIKTEDAVMVEQLPVATE
jgi:nicotinamide mononucleotide transporter